MRSRDMFAGIFTIKRVIVKIKISTKGTLIKVFSLGLKIVLKVFMF